MTNWAASLIPVGSLALGSVLTMVGQARSDRHASRRERENRRDEFRIRRYEIERDTLLALQDAVLAHMGLATRVLDTVDPSQKIKGFSDLIRDEMKIRMLANRCLNRDAADAVMNLCRQVKDHIGTVEAGKGPGPGTYEAVQRASDLLGEALRRDPFE